MTASPSPPPAPLEADDPDRAQTLKAKIRDRISDVRRHLLALRAAMAEFGEDFDLETFRAAYDSEDPHELNHVKAVERGVDQLYNYIAELSAFGLELAKLRQRRDDTNARRDLDALQRHGVLSGELTSRLQRLRELRRLLVHEYATATAEEIHESAQLVLANFPAFYNAYREWIKQGFNQPPRDPAKHDPAKQ
jgi:uncharacterized protein YutE (UPF0331/DUF86 family)